MTNLLPCLPRKVVVRLTVAVATACVLASPVRLKAQQGTSEEVTVVTATGTLAGTLTRPDVGKVAPLVIIVAGSGPTDRNGNTVGMASGPESYRMLADSLAAHGIASLRYDKRGVAASRGATAAESQLRFEMYADDAAAWVRQYRSDPRFSRLVLLGHSEGSLLGMLAVQREPTDAFISVAGLARRADLVIREQLAGQLPPSLEAQSDSMFAHLARGDTVANTLPMLASLFRPSVQPYMISWFRYTGATEIAKLRGAVLIVQGRHDIQVAPTEADQLARARPTAQVLMVDGMNHMLKVTPASKSEQLRFYTDPTVPLAPELITGIVRFVNTLQARK
ncbi:MAG: alpha/beta hydrolase [Gemmatimonadaceae bacterium]